MTEKNKTSYWTKKEEELLRNNYEELEWEEILELIPKKDEHQIVKKAGKIGLPKKQKVLDPYYDDVEKAWMQTTKIYGFGTVTNVFRASPNSTFKEVEKEYISNFIKGINDKLVSPKYNDFIRETGLKRSDETYQLFYELMFRKHFLNETVDDFPNLKERVENIFSNSRNL